MDEMLRAYLGETLEGLRHDVTAECLREAAAAAVSMLLAEMGRTDAATLLEWLRLGRHRLPAGERADTPHLRTALLAAGTLVKTTCGLVSSGWLEMDGGRVMVLVGDGSIPGPVLAAAARQRVMRALTQGVIAVADPVRVICAGFRGPLVASATATAADIIAPPSIVDIISGPAAVDVQFFRADDILRAAA